MSDNKSRQEGTPEAESGTSQFVGGKPVDAEPIASIDQGAVQTGTRASTGEASPKS